MNSPKAEAWSGGRLTSIDVLRGVAALGVVLFHAVGRAEAPRPTSLLQWPGFAVHSITGFGYVGVFLFFVISGFCIHLQWARARAAGQPNQIRFGAFWKRRLRRLYPAYLVALTLYLVVTGLSVGFKINGAYVYDVVMHLLMLHNFDPKTAYSINGVFWTLAIEEQLYLAYFLLLFLRTRLGWAATLIVCLGARVGWFYFSHAIWIAFGVGVPVPEAAASHWLTWALGAVSVEAACGLIKLPRWCRNLWIGFGALLVAVAISYIPPYVDKDGFIGRLSWLALHPAWGLGFFVIVNRAFEAEKKWRGTLAEKTGVVAASTVPGTPRIVALAAAIGVFSYSLYLTHGLVIIESWRFGTQSLPVLINALLITTPACLAFAWIFFQFCEAPFMSKSSTSRKTSVAQPPAPNITTTIPEAHQPIFVRSVSLAKE
jgi:peptidoglycan/LPS O-acetylase OafA/YrhL